MHEKQEIEHELVARRYWLEPVNEALPDELELCSERTAIPLCNVIDWEEASNFHEDVEDITAVRLPYDTKFVNIPFSKFHGIMTRYRKNGRDANRWTRFN